ncbi:MAG: hypothetical protein K6E95_02775 [Lachnospiraceae bacterium]|nr:hypothetical protein [Lachnospiraceae bacterium]
MKLKYYMRGVGLGIVFTVFIFTVIIIPNLEFDEITQLQESVNKQIGDSKVSSLLGNAGKTESDDNNGPSNENDVTPDPVSTPTPNPTVTPTPNPTATPTPEPTATPTPEPTATPTPEPTATPTPKPTATPTPKLTVTPTPKPTATPTPKPKTNDSGSKASVSKNSDGSFSVTIKSGCTSEILSDALQKAGATDSATELNKYIVRNGYASRIQTGTFKIKKGADYKEIVSAVTSKKK